MIIGIDGNEANVAVKVGIGEYAFELLKHFAEITNSPTSPRLRGASNVKFQIYLKGKPREDMPKEREGWKYIVVKPEKLWTQIGLPIHLYTHFPRPDVFFSPSHYAPRFSPVPTAISIMDVSYIHFPELFAKHDLYQLVNWTKYSAQQAKKIFTISDASKNDILKEYQRKAQDVVVTYPGIRPTDAKALAGKQESSNMHNEVSKKQVQEKYGVGINYILFVGTLQPRKNIVRLIEAFALIKNRHSELVPESKKPGSRIKSGMTEDLQLVIVGKKGWLYEDILAAPKKYGVEESVKFLDFVPDTDLPSLYQHAICYVLPSLYEGFGLPVLEAMKYGCPVITSNVSSLPEAGGDAAIYVDSKNPADIAEKIQMVLADEKLRKSMIQKGYAHIKKFSWEKAAKETLQVLVKLGENG